MCGIAGILSFRETVVQFESLEAMTGAMRHRGPDDEGYAVISDESLYTLGGTDTPEALYQTGYPYSPQGVAPPVEPFSVAFGHRRLAIQDLSEAGHQPMCTEDQRYWIVYNGEVYNFHELRKELELCGEHFYSDSDTEVVLKAYRLWGKECVKRFNGMWAFAIWDNQAKELFCSRDRVGIKPFYYYYDGNYFVFASDIKSIIASGLYEPEVDWEGIYNAMSFYCAPRPQTSFKNITALPQGNNLTLKEECINLETFWSVPLGCVDYSKKQGDWVEELEACLLESVSRRLIADVPVGTFMSGGIDSTTVTALAAQQHPGISAFTIGFDQSGQALDEVGEAEKTAALYDIDHLVERVTADSALAHLKEMVRGYEEPYHGLAANYVISEFVGSHNRKVVLNGLGADELFAGYRRDRFLTPWKIANQTKAGKLLPTFGNKQFARGKELLNQKTIVDYYCSHFSIFSEREKIRLLGKRKSSEQSSAQTFIDTYNIDMIAYEDDIQAMCHFDLVNFIGNHHVYRTDQFSMLFSFEARFPFLDHKLVELSFKIPSSMKVRRGQGKHVVRKVAAKHIEKSSLAMKKKGFALPLENWLKDKLKPLCDEKIVQLKKRDIFSSSNIDAIYSDFYKGKETSPNQLWWLVMFEMWLEEFRLGG